MLKGIKCLHVFAVNVNAASRNNRHRYEFIGKYYENKRGNYRVDFLGGRTLELCKYRGGT
jgi:hypothetical protein